MRNKILVSASFCFTLALMILFLPIKWIIAMVFAAGFHELCHLIAICICGKRMVQLRMDAYSARIMFPSMSRWKELICALSGPFGGMLLLILIPYFPHIALCAAAQSAYNLLPIYPLDGGRALKCLLSMLFRPPIAERILKCVESSVLVLFLLLGIYATFWLNYGLMTLFMPLLLFLRIKSRKIPCKPKQLRVQ